MSYEESPYYIIEFHDGMQLIPHTWFHVSKKKAYWPNFTNINKYDKAVQYMLPVGKDWILYDIVRILGSAQSFESGKQKLKLAETTSDLNTDVSDAETSKRNRRLRAAKKYDTDTDSDIQNEESILEPFSTITANKAMTTTKMIFDSKLENVQYVDTHCASSSRSSTKDHQLDNNILPSHSATISKGQKRHLITDIAMKTKTMKKNYIDKDVEDGKENLHPCISAGEQEFQQFVIKNMVNTKLSLQRCENILTNILTKMDTSNILQKEDTSVNDIIDEFPIKDPETLQTVEHRLKTNESYKNSIIKTLSMVGGNNLKSITTNILTRTLTNSIAAEYSWFGGKKKLVFCNLYLWKIILSVVRRHIPNAVEAEISQFIKIWLAHATERLQREER
ncbi:uncharacterized protein LOC116853111 isoform X4 [Odontomachus brunneus]|nr:uncharacterized protein LOC116853111 isoform X4 [Odontomachus brunneus]XP_032689878.1 uncharacterized protein LOC116853111 isoform X4 [Odontomachus brunneus]XP_032689879.1 uncharacterized protein LOC116853111 isoform X4 [Odontomachus brunneus]